MNPTPSILLSDPDISTEELQALQSCLQSPRLNSGPLVEAFEAAFAQYLGRHYAVAVGSATQGLVLLLKTLGIGQDDEVIAPAFSFRDTTHAVALAGATPVFCDVDYWSGTLAPDKVEERINDKTRALLVSNSNGHPAAWDELRKLADKHGLFLIEDSSEAIGSRYQGRLVGTFGDCSLFNFSQPGPLSCGEGGILVTDDIDLASRLRGQRGQRLEERQSVVHSQIVPMQIVLSDLNAALGLIQLRRLDGILTRRKAVQAYYEAYMLSFEGIKPPYVAPEVDEAHWFLYLVHLGTRFSRSSRDAILQDLATEGIEAAAYSVPLHLQGCYKALGYSKGSLFVTEKLADRAVALPFHGHLTEDQVGFIVETAKDASINVGAGAAIYL
jgi:dTDP-4-amino-4,6-dideoxygalactose transaminase